MWKGTAGSEINPKAWLSYAPQHEAMDINNLILSLIENLENKNFNKQDVGVK